MGDERVKVEAELADVGVGAADAKGRYLYNVRKVLGIFDPLPPCPQICATSLTKLVCFWGALSPPHPLLTLYKHPP